jgi:hypothetical protein
MVQPIQSGLNMPRGASFAAADGADADTIININHQETPQTTAPIIVQQPQPTYTPAVPQPTYTPAVPQPTYTPAVPQPTYAPAPRIGGNIADVPRQTITMKPVTKHSVNWGGVVKGALIVTGIVVAGVVGYWALSAAAGWAVGTPLGVATVNALAPVVTAAGNGLAYLGGFLSNVPAIIGGFFSGAAQALGLTTAIAPATVATISGSAGALGGGAAAAGVTALGGAAALESVHLFDHTPTHVAVATPIDANHDITTTHTHGGMFDGIKSMFTGGTPNHGAAADVGVPESGSANLANAEAARRSIEHANHAAAHANQTAAELGHHSLEHHDAHGAFHLPHLGRHENAGSHHEPSADHQDSASPDVDIPDEAPGSRRRNWRDRLTGANNYQQAFQSTGSHGAAIRASQSVGTPIQPRANDFTQALQDDRVKLEAALGDNNR